MGLDFTHCQAMWSYEAFNEFRLRLRQEQQAKPWSLDQADPAFVLLEHSDCQGFIAPEDCVPLANRLAVLVRDWEFCDRDRVQAARLIQGLRIAGARRERLLFQ